MKQRFAGRGWKIFVFVMTILSTNGIMAVVTSSFAASESVCQSYARDYARRYAAMLPRAMSHGLPKSTLFNRAFERCMHDDWP
jgi:hypothetical protein